VNAEPAKAVTFKAEHAAQACPCRAVAISQRDIEQAPHGGIPSACGVMRAHVVSRSKILRN